MARILLRQTRKKLVERQTMAKSSHPRGPGSAGRTWVRLLVACIVLGLAGSVLYLMSDIHSRRFRLTSRNGGLVIERGLFLPAGFGTYAPVTEQLRAAYSVVPLPTPHTVIEPQVFDDRIDLDRGLFALMVGWIYDGMKSDEPGALLRISDLVERCQMLLGLSDEQRIELRGIRSELSVRTGHDLIARADDLLYAALASFKQAQEMSPSRSGEAEEGIAEVGRRLAVSNVVEPEPLGPTDLVVTPPVEVTPREPAPDRAPREHPISPDGGRDQQVPVVVPDPVSITPPPLAPRTESTGAAFPSRAAPEVSPGRRFGPASVWDGATTAEEWAL